MRERRIVVDPGAAFRRPDRVARPIPHDRPAEKRFATFERLR